LAARTVQIALAFGVDIDKDVVRRVLMVHYRPESDSGGPSWLTFIGHMKDSLWSCDLFRCESATLRTYWVLVVMDQFTRRIPENDGRSQRCPIPSYPHPSLRSWQQVVSQARLLLSGSSSTHRLPGAPILPLSADLH
jgi:hypothetical protein